MAVITAPFSARVDEMVYFSGSNSYDPDGDVLTYFWDFGDGTTLTSQEANHLYQSVGQYLVSLMVVDEQGFDDTTEQTIQILAENNYYSSGTNESDSVEDSENPESESVSDDDGISDDAQNDDTVPDDSSDDSSDSGGENNDEIDNSSVDDSNDSDTTADDSVPVVQYLASDLTINEIISDPVGGQSEWIELYNNTDQQIDLTNWTIEDNTASSKSLDGLTISPHNWIVLTGGGIDFNFFLNNSGDILKLKYQDQLIDQIENSPDH